MNQKSQSKVSKKLDYKSKDRLVCINYLSQELFDIQIKEIKISIAIPEETQNF